MNCALLEVRVTVLVHIFWNKLDINFQNKIRTLNVNKAPFNVYFEGSLFTMNYTLQCYIDCGAPTQRISKRNSTGNASWERSPNWISNFYKQCKFMLAHTKCNLSVTWHHIFCPRRTPYDIHFSILNFRNLC